MIEKIYSAEKQSASLIDEAKLKSSDIISNAAEKAKSDINSATEKASEYARELRASVQNKTKDGINEVVNIIIA